MTREEEITKIFKRYDMPTSNPFFFEILKLLEPCEDAISRQTVLDTIKEVCFSREPRWIAFRVSYGSNGQRDFIINFIESLPSVTTKVAEREDTISMSVLEDIKTEIEREYLSEGHLTDYWDGIDKALEIIDKRISGKENK